MLDRVTSNNELLLELPWYGLGNVVFRFDLKGSRAAYREACK